MAVKLLIEGQYTTPSNVSGKYDIADYSTSIAYPIAIDEDDYTAQREAMFYIKNLFLKKVLKKELESKFKGLRSAEITVVKEMTDEEIAESLESGELMAIDPYSLTASEINKFKDKEIFWTLILMDGDNTTEIARTKSVWIGTDMQGKRSKLKSLLGIQEEVEQVVSKDTKKKSALFKAAGKEVSETETKRKRPARKPKATVTVSD